MHISSQFDSGNIEVVSAQSPDDIRLTIPNDNQSEFAQWFHWDSMGGFQMAAKSCLHNTSYLN